MNTTQRDNTTRPRKLTVKFMPGTSATWPCVAVIELDNQLPIVEIGKTWADAEAEAIARAKAQFNAGPPPPEKEVIL